VTDSRLHIVLFGLGPFSFALNSPFYRFCELSLAGTLNSKEYYSFLLLLCFGLNSYLNHWTSFSEMTLFHLISFSRGFGSYFKLDFFPLNLFQSFLSSSRGIRSIKFLKRIHFFLYFIWSSSRGLVCFTLVLSSRELVGDIFLLGVSTKTTHFKSFVFFWFCFYIPKVTLNFPFLLFAVCPNIVVKIYFVRS